MLQLSKVAAGYSGKDVVSDVSFDVKNGENLCLIGPNGCGKTTLLKAIGGLIDYKGSILVDHKEVKSYKRTELATKIAFLSQITNIYFSYTVFETVMLGRYTKGKGGILGSYRKEDVDVVNNCIKQVGLEKEMEKQIDTLSGGQLQRVFLARTFAQEPEIILLDEPTNHLDLKHQVDLVNYLKEWTRKRNKITVGVLHDMNLALTLGDRFTVLKDGNVLFVGEEEGVKSEILEAAFDMNVTDYMLKSLKRWE